MKTDIGNTVNLCALCVTALFVFGSASAIGAPAYADTNKNGEIAIETTPTNRVVISEASLATKDGQTVIQGEVRARGIYSRGPRQGHVAVEVYDAAGNSVATARGEISPHFVRRGLRPGVFRVTIDQPVPAGGRAELRFQR